MAELYFTKEALRRLYRCHGYERAKRSLTGLLDHMAASELPEIKRLRRTLKKWREEILNHFRSGLTNAMTEGFNNKAKVVKRMGYGYRSQNNFRLRVNRRTFPRMAEREGFEPSLVFLLNTLSKRAPSATRPSLRWGTRNQPNS